MKQRVPGTRFEQRRDDGEVNETGVTKTALTWRTDPGAADDMVQRGTGQRLNRRGQKAQRDKDVFDHQGRASDGFWRILTVFLPRDECLTR